MDMSECEQSYEVTITYTANSEYGCTYPVQSKRLHAVGVSRLDAASVGLELLILALGSNMLTLHRILTITVDDKAIDLDVPTVRYLKIKNYIEPADDVEPSNRKKTTAGMTEQEIRMSALNSAVIYAQSRMYAECSARISINDVISQAKRFEDYIIDGSQE